LSLVILIPLPSGPALLRQAWQCANIFLYHNADPCVRFPKMELYP
jgi:hypothetical protein